VLDDGFQYQALHRDVDLVLVDAQRLVGNGQLLPLGPLREPLSVLATRATHLCFTRFEGTQLVNELVGVLKVPSTVPVSTVGLQAVGWQLLINNASEKPLELLALSGKSALIVSGIANPAQFEAMVEALGVKGLVHWQQPDHAVVVKQTVLALVAQWQQLGKPLLITTEKDAPKWQEALQLLEQQAADDVSQQQVYQQILAQFLVLQVAFTVPDALHHAVNAVVLREVTV